jgi:transcriptional regulator with XRE-family HTH domain
MPKPLGLPFDADRMRGRREREGLSLTQLADRCTANGKPVTRQHLGLLETGRRSPSPSLLRAIADALGAEIADLLDEDDEQVAVGQ